jgi:hypothetical protein
MNTNNKCHADFIQSTRIYPKLNQTTSNIMDAVSFAPFLMWNEHDSKYFENIGINNRKAIDDNNIYDTSKSCNNNNYSDLMTEAFFSAENMDIIQNMLIKNVFYKSEETLRINKIKQETLIQVMNSIWTNHCRFLPYNLKEQIAELNRKVSDYLVPLLINESKFYFNYLRDSDRTSLPQLDRPIMIVKERKQQLPSYYK